MNIYGRNTYKARAKRGLPKLGLLTNLQDIYHIYQAQLIQLGLENVQFFYVLRFTLRYLKRAQKTVRSSKNDEKITKIFPPLFGDPI